MLLKQASEKSKKQERSVSFIQWPPAQYTLHAESWVTRPSAGVLWGWTSLMVPVCERFGSTGIHSSMIYIWEWGQCTVLALTFTSSVTWGKFLKPHFWNRYIGIPWWKISMRIKWTKCLEQTLTINYYYCFSYYPLWDLRECWPMSPLLAGILKIYMMELTTGRKCLGSWHRFPMGSLGGVSWFQGNFGLRPEISLVSYPGSAWGTRPNPWMQIK